MRIQLAIVAIVLAAGCTTARGPVVRAGDPVPTPKPEVAKVAPVSHDDDDDGIINAEDQCPTQPEDVDGYEDQDGCPELDNDNDGIPDVDDQCPMDPELHNGYQDEDGCHDHPPKVVVIAPIPHPVNTNLHFESGSSRLLPRDLPLVDEAAAVLQANPKVHLLEIQGHADDPGNEKRNLKLSQRRAEAVRDALIHRGIAPDRLVAKGYGRTRPVARTSGLKGKARSEARAKNRRVQYLILERQ